MVSFNCSRGDVLLYVRRVAIHLATLILYPFILRAIELKTTNMSLDMRPTVPETAKNRRRSRVNSFFFSKSSYFDFYDKGVI